MSKNEDKLIELEDKVESLRRRGVELNGEAERWKGERERLNESVRKIRTEALSYREERDRANQMTAEIKRRVEVLRDRIAEKERILAKFDATLERGRRNLPPRQDVEERLRRIEWEVMTTPTKEILEREKALIDEAKRLKKELGAQEKLDAREDERPVIQAEIKATERRVLETCLKMGIPPRAEIGSAEQAKHYLDLGVRHFCIGTDITILYSWLKENGENLRKVIADA